MRNEIKYLVNLTDTLIGKHAFDEAWRRIRGCGQTSFLDHVKLALVKDVTKMNSATIAKIIDVAADTVSVNRTDLEKAIVSSCSGQSIVDFHEVHRDLAKLALAYVIMARLDPESRRMIPPYRQPQEVS